MPPDPDFDPSVPVAKALGLPLDAVRAVIRLLDEGATVPFIARYRKEATGSLDEVAVALIRDAAAEARELERRRESMLDSLRERDILTPELERALRAAATLTELEDLYLPHRPKRRTRATIARENGYEPLAERIFAQRGAPLPADDDARAGARDIMAEWMAENPDARAELRDLYTREARLRSKVIAKKKDDAAKFRDYFEWEESLGRAPSHRVLAILRGQNEGFLTVHARPDEERALGLLRRRFRRGRGPEADEVELAITDAYKRLIAPSLEREALKEAKERADRAAIEVFAKNLRELLMAAPLGEKSVLAIDPGFRTGCKWVVLDAQGELRDHGVVYLHRETDAGRTIAELVERHGIDAVAIGNGTAGRETETLVRSLGLSIPIALVNESGASVYSASDVAREEFPELDLTVRGAISIGRRLQDPLAELVKVEPKAIGVGQYQHDVDPAALQRSLDDVVSSCVNSVGVDLNTASVPLLGYVSGLNGTLAKNIVAKRRQLGTFRSRRELLDVSRLGPRAFEQAAGFLRIRSAEHPLDASAVHPERYELVERMASDRGADLGAMLGQELDWDLSRYVGPEVGLPTLEDITRELAKPGRDPRPGFEAFEFAAVNDLADLTPGMRLPGIVTNVTNFGAFVDVGVHQDGLVHVSELADRFVDDPHEVVKVQDRVSVLVLEVDHARRRIALSLKR